MTEDEEARCDEARRNAFLLDAMRDLLAAIDAEQARDPGDEVAETLCRIRIDAARVRAQGIVDYFDRRKYETESA